MSDDKDEKDVLKYFNDRGISLKKEGEFDIEEARKLADAAQPLVSIRVVNPNEQDDSVGILIEWGQDFGNPDKWDMDNLTPQQAFCIMLMRQVQDLMLYTAQRNEEATPTNIKKPNPFVTVTQDNYKDILEKMEAIDKDKMN